MKFVARIRGNSGDTYQRTVTADSWFEARVMVAKEQELDPFDPRLFVLDEETARIGRYRR